MKELRNTGDARYGERNLGVSLFCPRSENGATAIKGNDAGTNLELLGQMAAEMLCGKCPFGSLSRIAGEELRIAEINISLERIAKQKELAAAQADYRELQRTITTRVEAALGAAAAGAPEQTLPPTTPEPPEQLRPPTDGRPTPPPSN